MFLIIFNPYDMPIIYEEAEMISNSPRFTCLVSGI